MYVFNIRYLVLLLAGAAFLAGCAGSRTVVTSPPGELPPDFPNHSAQTVARTVAHVTDSIQAFKGTGEISLKTPEKNGSYRAHLQQSSSDSLLVSLSPGWGIVAARGLATADSLYLYDRVHHQLYYGPSRLMQKVLPELGSLPKLFANLTGTLTPEKQLDWQIRADSSRYYLEARSHSHKYVYEVDPRLWRVVRYTVRSTQGTLIDERLYSEFYRVEGTYMPHQITVRRPLQKTQLTVAFDEIVPNPGDLSFAFSIDPSVKRIPLEIAIEE